MYGLPAVSVGVGKDQAVIGKGIQEGGIRFETGNIGIPVHTAPILTRHAFEDKDHYVRLRGRGPVILLYRLDIGVDIFGGSPMLDLEIIGAERPQERERRIEDNIALVRHGDVLVGVHHVNGARAVPKNAPNTADHQYEGQNTDDKRGGEIDNQPGYFCYKNTHQPVQPYPANTTQDEQDYQVPVRARKVRK